LKQQWCIGRLDSAFLARMEDVLDLYATPDSEAEPTVCVDEKLVQLVREVRQPVAAKPGQVARYDYEYHREGTANLFMVVRPSVGWRHVEVTARRTTGDFAEFLRDVVDVHFPTARKIRLVTDNLNTHTLGALYERFAAAEARRIARKLEWHYTPKHGSWLNQVEIELGVLERQCLERRLPSRETLAREIAAWQERRNTKGARINWRFSLEVARDKFQRHYPSNS
jgi:hypothetical protein